MADRWFALQVYSGREKAVSNWLAELNLRRLLLTYEDRRQWSDRIQVIHVPLFPGYLFCQFEYTQRSKVLSVPGVQKIVGYGNQPTPVDSDEMAELLKLEHSPLPLEPWPYLREGDFVSIDRGPLEGLKGRVVEVKNKARVVVSVTLLSRAVAVEIDKWSLQPSRKETPREPLLERAHHSGGMSV